MFEQDYIIRLIKEMVRTILKLLFNINTDTPTAELLNETKEREVLYSLLDFVDNGNISEAKKQICELTSNRDLKNLEIALLFYSYLNDKTDDFLEENNFSREEIKEGLKDIISKYGLSSFIDIFLMDF